MSFTEQFVHDFEIDSHSLAARRQISVFLPPGYSADREYPVVYCTDGQALHGFSDVLCDQIRRGFCPATILIGVHSVPQLRGREYVIGVDQAVFEVHERFFITELYDWARQKWNFSTNRDRCGIFGFSNGGAFSIAMGTRHRERFGVVIAFSIAGGHERIPEAEYIRTPALRYYLSAGTREKPFRDTGRAIAAILSRNRVDHNISERCAGHDFEFWASELPKAICWSFQTKSEI